MIKYKVTIIEQHTGFVVAEIVDGFSPPLIQTPIHFLSDGRMGTFIKLELVLDADKENIINNSTQY